ncbi:MAG TPA: hypothetical protein VGD67_13475 [Pseudonocardiaceae bacterium]
MRIVFRRAAQGESVATIHRDDGIVLELPSFSRKHRIPHDLAHAVTERELGLADGVFGSIAAGAVFGNMRVVAGRTRHDAAARSTRVLDANRRALALAEIMAGMLHQEVEGTVRLGAVQAARRGWGSLRQEPFPWTDEQVLTAAGVLREHGERWVALGPADTLDFPWPARLVAPLPADDRRHRRSAHRARR